MIGRVHDLVEIRSRMRERSGVLRHVNRVDGHNAAVVVSGFISGSAFCGLYGGRVDGGRSVAHTASWYNLRRRIRLDRTLGRTPEEQKPTKNDCDRGSHIDSFETAACTRRRTEASVPSVRAQQPQIL